jgi:hypothetical protein
MKIDIELKDKVQAYISKRYFINDENQVIVINSNDHITPKMLYNDVLAIFGVDWDFTYYIVYDWLYVNEMSDIAQNWDCRNNAHSEGYNTTGAIFRSPGVYTREVDLSQITLTASTQTSKYVCFTGSTTTGPVSTPIFVSSKEAADGIYR